MTTRTTTLGTGTFVLVTAAVLFGSDAWDLQVENDNSHLTTENELVHGSDQLHDLEAVAMTTDEDWFVIGQKPYSSYEIVVDSTSGDIGTGVLLERVASDGTTVLQSAQPVSAGLDYSVSLRIENATGAEVDDELVRVMSNSCSTTCTANDVYRVRAFETTYAIPRFNNASTQVTVLILQNPAAYVIDGNVHFWDGAGTLLHTESFSLAPKTTFVLGTHTVVPGESGAMTVTHDGRYGDLAGKTVALEPATGFSFDTPMVHRPK